MTDIEITRQGKWEVQVDGVVTSSHNEAKEGYENLVEQKLNNADKLVELVPNFRVIAQVTESNLPESPVVTLTDAEIQAMIEVLPLFEANNTYDYVYFEITNEGVKNLSPVKTVVK